MIRGPAETKVCELGTCPAQLAVKDASGANLTKNSAEHSS